MILSDVCIDNDVSQPLNKRKKLLNVGVGHADGLLAKQLTYLLDGHCHLAVGIHTYAAMRSTLFIAYKSFTEP